MIELSELPTVAETTDAEHGHEFDALPPADTGKQAWLFLAGAFMIEALVWGFPFSFGVYQSYYSTHPQFSGARGIAAIGTTASGIMYLSAPLTAYILTKYPPLRRRAATFGLAICTLSLIAASFATSVAALLATQGVLYALGGSLLYTPVILYVDEWFISRKGLAYGVMWAGTGASGLVLPLATTAGLARYGYATVHRFSALTLLLLAAPLLHYVRPRLPINTGASAPPRVSTAFLRSRTFWLLQAGNIVEGLGFFLPALYLPSYAESLGLSATAGSALVSILNAASVAGQVALGALSDRVHISRVVAVSCVGAAGSVFLAWGLAGGSLGGLVAFCVAYGFFAGGFTSTYAGTCREVTQLCPGTQSATVFGMLAAGRGVGNVVCGPVSEGLLAAWKSKGGSGTGAVGAYGTQFAGLVVVTGVTAVVGGLGGLAKEERRRESE